MMMNGCRMELHTHIHGDTVDYLFQPYLATIRSNACFASISSYARSGFESSRVFGSDMISLRICTIILYRHKYIDTGNGNHTAQ